MGQTSSGNMVALYSILFVTSLQDWSFCISYPLGRLTSLCTTAEYKISSVYQSKYCPFGHFNLFI